MATSGTGLPPAILNLALVGRTGNGKSSAGNSILSEKFFKAKRSAQGVTSLSQGKIVTLGDGRRVNVIDTPGLFDMSSDQKDIKQEILNCIGLAKDGVNAFILVFSIRNRYTKEEEATFKCFQNFFGKKFVDYLVILFTGRDDFEEDETLEKYLRDECPESLKKIVEACQKRVVAFDNKTTNESEKLDQVNRLVEMVDRITKNTNGKPYSNEMFDEFKRAQGQRSAGEGSSLEGHPTQEETNPKTHQEQFKRFTEMFEARLKDALNETHEYYQKELADLKKKSDQERKESEAEIASLCEKLKEAKKRWWECAIM